MTDRVENTRKDSPPNDALVSGTLINFEKIEIPPPNILSSSNCIKSCRKHVRTRILRMAVHYATLGMIVTAIFATITLLSLGIKLDLQSCLTAGCILGIVCTGILLHACLVHRSQPYSSASVFLGATCLYPVGDLSTNCNIAANGTALAASAALITPTRRTTSLLASQLEAAMISKLHGDFEPLKNSTWNQRRPSYLRGGKTNQKSLPWLDRAAKSCPPCHPDANITHVAPVRMLSEIPGGRDRQSIAPSNYAILTNLRSGSVDEELRGPDNSRPSSMLDGTESRNQPNSDRKIEIEDRCRQNRLSNVDSDYRVDTSVSCGISILPRR